MGAYLMKRKLIALCLLPLMAFAQWEMDFDEDFAAAVASGAWSPLELSPMAWYRGDGNANDSSGNNRHGFWEGTASYTNGVNGMAFTGFSTANWVSSEGGMFHSITGTAAFTVCAWVKPYSYVHYGWVFGLSDFHDVRHVNLTNGPHFSTFTSLGQVFNNIILLPGETGHLAISRSNNVMRGYYNAALIYTHTFSGFANYTGAATAPIGIGRGYAESTLRTPFNGYVDDYMVFDRALTTDEITQIYEWRE